MQTKEYINNRRKERRERGVCIYCQTPVVARTSCKKCADRMYELAKKRGDRKKYFIKNRERLNAENLKRYYKRKYGGLYEIVLERDSYSCTKCGKSSNLIVHHIDGNGYYSKNPNNSIDNLITLCTSCHGYLHRSIQRFEKNVGKKTMCSICNKNKQLYNKKHWCCSVCYRKIHLFPIVKGTGLH